jgi:Tol biopolymer transport system component
MNPSISSDGRFVAFSSSATNLVDDDTNHCEDVFVHDRQMRTTSRVSVAPDGTQSSGLSKFPAISSDGRFVAFASIANNLVEGDTNDARDVFVHDRQTGATTRVSVASDGTQGNADSCYLFDLAISSDGRFVGFSSGASNLVDDDTNGKWGVFVHDCQTQTTTRVSVASDGTQGNEYSIWPFVSSDGHFVAFMSHASNLVDDDTNGKSDVFVHDCQTQTTTRVSVASDGTQGNNFCGFACISSDGRFVAFDSEASNLVDDDTNDTSDVFVHDRLTQTTTRISAAYKKTGTLEDIYAPSISSDGRFVAFVNFVDDDTNGSNGVDTVLVRDRQTGTTTKVSVTSDGTLGNANSGYPSISSDGRFVAFGSKASNLVEGDINGTMDVFVWERASTGGGGGGGGGCFIRVTAAGLGW